MSEIEKLTDDGKLTKHIIKPGHGIKPTKKSQVSGMYVLLLFFFFFLLLKIKNTFFFLY